MAIACIIVLERKLLKAQRKKVVAERERKDARAQLRMYQKLLHELDHLNV